MTPESIRLECLKLVHRHDRDAQEIVARATEFERYVQGSQSPAKAGGTAKAKNL